jgi:membrane fusion protein
VTEGQRVKKGDPLFVLSTDQASRGEPQAQAAAIEHIRARLQRAARERQAQQHIETGETGLLHERVRSMETELEQLDASIEVQTKRATTARSTAESYRAYFERHLLTRLDLERADADALEQLGRQHELQRTRTALLRELEAARGALQTARFATEKRVAELERQELSLQQELTESDLRRIQVITAPMDGTATSILGERGATAHPQTPLLAILPNDSTLQAQLLAPSRAIGSIAVGDRVSLRYQAFPYQQYGVSSGVITEISKTLLTSAELDGPIRSDEPVYRVTVALAAQTMAAGTEHLPLRAGMQLEADIWLERRRLIAWLFDPLSQLAGGAR